MKVDWEKLAYCYKILFLNVCFRWCMMSGWHMCLTSAILRCPWRRKRTHLTFWKHEGIPHTLIFSPRHPRDQVPRFPDRFPSTVGILCLIDLHIVKGVLLVKSGTISDLKNIYKYKKRQNMFINKEQVAFWGSVWAHLKSMKRWSKQELSSFTPPISVFYWPEMEEYE